MARIDYSPLAHFRPIGYELRPCNGQETFVNANVIDMASLIPFHGMLTEWNIHVHNPASIYLQVKPINVTVCLASASCAGPNVPPTISSSRCGAKLRRGLTSPSTATR